jgi:hypothetical protein
MDEIDGLISLGLNPAADLSPLDVDGDGAADWQALAGDPRVEVHDVGVTMVGVDLDRDGDWEALASDQTGDGVAEVTMRDRDGDGSLESVDTTLPGSLPFGAPGSGF